MLLLELERALERPGGAQCRVLRSALAWPTEFPVELVAAQWPRLGLPMEWSAALPGGTGTTRAVATGGFGNNGIGGSGPQVAKPQPVNFTAPVVLSEPHPQYTEEARSLKIQGEVTLQVRFTASGQVEVLQVVAGLGHGLDEQAKRVAEQIRFKPAMRNGQAVDDVTYIHITFQLA